jgi:iron complex outermembrane receptor protein
VLKNAGRMRSQGAEFEISAAPTEQLRFDLGAAYIDAKYVEFKGASCYDSQTVAQGCVPLDPNDPNTIMVQDLSGKPLPFAPKYSGSASVNYDFVIPAWHNLKEFVRLDYTYEGRIQYHLGVAPLNWSHPTGVLGLSLGVKSSDERYELQGYVKNLTNRFVVNGLTGGNEVIEANLQPNYRREAGAIFNYRF